MGKRATLKVTGRKHLQKYHPRIRSPGRPTVVSQGERWFCNLCGTHLWVADDRWPEGMWPNVAAIDTPLPPAPEHVFMMLRFRPNWVQLDSLGPGQRFAGYPKLSIAEWHARQGLTTPDDSQPAGPKSGGKKSRERRA